MEVSWLQVAATLNCDIPAEYNTTSTFDESTLTPNSLLFEAVTDRRGLS